MTKAEALMELLKSEFGIETLEQFEEAYRKCPKIITTPFVATREDERVKEKIGA